MIAVVVLLSAVARVHGGLGFSSTSAQSTIMKLTSTRPIEDVASEYGYKVTPHTVKTSDGYLVIYHRLGDPAGQPVLVMNGLLMSSATLLSHQHSLPYALAKKGFDVWMGNYRGNMFGRHHEQETGDFNPSWPHVRFWDKASLHELAIGDLPAGIAYILQENRHDKLVYVGIEAGTTMFFMLAARYPGWTDQRVLAMLGLSPLARPSNANIVNTWTHILLDSLWGMRVHEFLSHDELPSALISNTCSVSWINTWCRRAIEMYLKFSKQFIDYDSVMDAMSYAPAGASMKSIIHLIQIGRSGKFREYDYRTAGNMAVYEQPEPPAYNLTAITTPMVWTYSDKDVFVTKKDIEWLMTQLPRLPKVYLLEDVKQFQTPDFNYNKDLRTLVAEPMANLISKIFNEMAHDFEDAWTSELEKFQFSKRITKDDLKNNVKSTNRKLNEKLLLVVKQMVGTNHYWLLPQGIRQEGETMRQVAERVLKETCGTNLQVKFFGNAPCGFYKFKYPKKGNIPLSTGMKIFFFKAQLINGNISNDSSINFQWLGKDELSQHLVHEDYLKSVEMFLH